MTVRIFDFVVYWSVFDAYLEIAKAVFAGLTLLTVFVAAVIALRQMREATRARQIHALVVITDLLGRKEVEEARRATHGLSNDYDPDGLEEEMVRSIELVVRSYQRTGFLLWLGLIPERHLLPNYSASALGQWCKLHRYVKLRREKEGYEVGRYFEYLAWRSYIYRKHVKDKDTLKAAEPWDRWDDRRLSPGEVDASFIEEDWLKKQDAGQRVVI